jgi:catechol 2,3-dioxygenase-like lactoylglutathione lyase family enzyme
MGTWTYDQCRRSHVAPLTASPHGSYDPAVSEGRIDHGVTHVAMGVTNLDASLEFYERYAAMQVVHRRADPGGNAVAWLSDLTRPFVVVLIETETVDAHLGGVFGHIGVGVESREVVDRLLSQARDEGRGVFGPLDSGPPVGYWGYIVDPDGHNLELSYGQEVRLTVEGFE